jgi:hypothetical protein
MEKSRSFQGEQDENPSRSSGPERCLARGCPQPGTTTDSTKGGGPWTCSAHRKAAPDQWPEITQRANAAPWIFRAMAKLTNEGASEPFAEQVSTVCRARGLEGLAYQPAHESLRQWAGRFRLAAIGWLESGEVRSLPFGLKAQRDNPAAPAAGNVASIVGRIK